MAFLFKVTIFVVLPFLLLFVIWKQVERRMDNATKLRLQKEAKDEQAWKAIREITGGIQMKYKVDGEGSVMKLLNLYDEDIEGMDPEELLQLVRERSISLLQPGKDETV